MAGHYTAVTGYSAELRNFIKRCLTQSPDRRPSAGRMTGPLQPLLTPVALICQHAQQRLECLQSIAFA